MTIGQKIINGNILLIDEADEVYNDLEQLNTTGIGGSARRRNVGCGIAARCSGWYKRIFG